MGTTYHITANLTKEHDASALQQDFQRRLEEIERSMSTYWHESEINQFSRAELNTPVPVSSDFVQVLKVSQDIYKQSNGAFNPGVGALVEVWGFGSRLSIKNFQQKPSEEAIAEAKTKMGFTQVVVENQNIHKLAPAQLDFSAVAKGYAVDELARVLAEQQVSDYMVEIGGEVATKGKSSRGDAWRIGVEAPSRRKGLFMAALVLNDANVATSGDYRNYYEIDGVRYSHTIDPRTGYPVNHKLASVTVVAKSTAEADAWATALMVLGEEEGFKLAEKLGLSAYFIYRSNEDFESKYTQPMRVYLGGTAVNSVQ